MKLEKDITRGEFLRLFLAGALGSCFNSKDANGEVFKTRNGKRAVDGVDYLIYGNGRKVRYESQEVEDCLRFKKPEKSIKPDYKLPTEFTIEGITVGPPNCEVDFFSDGELHREFSGPYVSYNKEKKKFAIGVPTGYKELYVVFKPGNKIIEMDKGKFLEGKVRGINVINSREMYYDKSHLSLDTSLDTINRDKIINVNTFGLFSVIGGDKEVLLNAKKSFPVFKKILKNSGKKPPATIGIKCFDSRGRAITGSKRVYITSNGKVYLS